MDLDEVPTMLPTSRSPQPSADDGEWQRIADDRFVDQRRIGGGGMGEVWLALDSRQRKEVCRKRPNALSPEVLSRFARELRAMKGLVCSEIVPLQDFGRDSKGPFLIMPFYKNGTLLDRMRASGRGPMTGAEFLELAKRMARALSLLHGKGILHRDVKPGNILFDDAGGAVLADFGLAADPDIHSTGVGPIGTSDYMAPELKEGGKATPASDIYSLGLTFRFALTGSPPGSGRDSDMSEPWRSCVLRCTERFPDKRIRDARELLVELERMSPTPSPSASRDPRDSCHSCGSHTDRAAHHCGVCGTLLQVKCGACGKLVRVGISYCDHCGTGKEQREQAYQLLEDARARMRAGDFRQAQNCLDQIHRIAPRAQSLTAPAQSEIRELQPRATKLRELAQQTERTSGPRASERHWRDLLQICPDDAAAKERLLTIAQRQQAHEFSAECKTVRLAIEEADGAPGDELVVRILQLAANDAQKRAAAGLKELQEHLQQARLKSIEQAAHAHASKGQIAEARAHIAEMKAYGVKGDRIAAIESIIRRARRQIVRRDAAVTATVLLLTVASLGFLLTRPDPDWAQEVAAKLELGEHTNARERIARIPEADNRRPALEAALAAWDAISPGQADKDPSLPSVYAALAGLDGIMGAGERRGCRLDLFQHIQSGLKQSLRLENGRLLIDAHGFEVDEKLLEGLTLSIDGTSIPTPERSRCTVPDSVPDGQSERTFGFKDAEGREHRFTCVVRVKRQPPRLRFQPERTGRLEFEVGQEAQIELVCEDGSVLEGDPVDSPRLIPLATPGSDLKSVDALTGLSIDRTPGGWSIRLAAKAPTEASFELAAEDFAGNKSLPLKLEVRASMPKPPPLPAAELTLTRTPPTLTNQKKLTLQANANRAFAWLTHKNANPPSVVPVPVTNGALEIDIELCEGRNDLEIAIGEESMTAQTARTYAVTLDSIAPSLQTELPSLLKDGEFIELQFSEPVRIADAGTDWKFSPGPSKDSEGACATWSAEPLDNTDNAGLRQRALAFEAIDKAENHARSNGGIVVQWRQARHETGIKGALVSSRAGSSLALISNSQHVVAQSFSQISKSTTGPKDWPAGFTLNGTMPATSADENYWAVILDGGRALGFQFESFKGMKMPFAPFPVLAPEAEVVALAFNKVGNDPSGSVSVVQRHKGKSNFQIDVFDAKFRRRTRSKELQMSSKPTVFGDGRGNLLLCDGTKNLFAVQDSDGTWIVRPTRIPKNVRCLAACGDSQYRLVGTTEGTLHLVDLNTSEPSADQGRKVHDRAITSASGDRVQDGKRKKGDLMELDYTVGCEDGTLVVSHLQATGCATALRVNTGKSPLVAVGPQKSNKNAHEVVAIDKEGVIHQILIATNKSRSMPQ